MKSVLTVIGTRPEAIKLAPFLAVIDKTKNFLNKVCITNQHKDLLNSILLNLGIKADYQFENDEKEGNLYQSAARILGQCGQILRELKPDLMVVQGDTTTTFAAALAAFYAHIPIAHIEAGLRTGNLYSPWPEEGHRCLIDKLASYFFAPTLQAQRVLIAEGVCPKKIWVVGNTSIDAIRLGRTASTLMVKSAWRTIIVTVHRRENHGKPLEEICHALRIIVQQFSDVRIVFFLHPNPAVRKPVSDMLSEVVNIDLIEPTDHASFIKFLDECVLVMTDSGGIQEEASFIGKPVLIIRDTTERPEGIHAGTARLVGTNSTNIINSCQELLENSVILSAMSKLHYPYGDGYAAERIVNILDQELREVPS